MTLVKIAFVAALLLLPHASTFLSSARATPAAPSTTLFVSRDAQEFGLNIDCARPFSNMIQAAISAANPGDTVHVCAGVYDEQLSLTKTGVTVEGDGMGLTIIKPTAVTSFPSPDTGSPIASIILFRETFDVNLQNLTVDGSLLTFTTCPPFEFGILYLKASGTVRSVQVTNVWDIPLYACGVGIGLSSRGVPNTVLFDSNILHGYNNGIRCTGDGATCIMSNNTFLGQGPIDYSLQGGIVVARGALAQISGNIITGHFFIPRGNLIDCTSVGIVLFNVNPDTNPHILQLNTFADNELNVQRQASSVSDHAVCLS